jgi:hypothetical protein
MGPLQYAVAALAIFLDILVISTLLRGGYRKYPLIFALIILDILGSVASCAAIFDLGKWTHETAKLYWLCEGIQYTVVFACQIQMLYPTFRDNNRRSRVAYLVIAGILYTALSVWLSYDRRFGLWMTQVARNSCFASIFLNLALWTSLIRNFDRERLMITAAFGFMLTGSAIGHSLRRLSPDLVSIGNAVLMGLYLLYLYTLWRALRTAPALAQSPQETLPVGQASACVKL